MTRTLMHRLSLLILFLLLFGAAPALAAEGQIYTIKKGDTLWDLSKKFIDDPYYWPNIWAKNPKITNPHLIFPGQKVRIVDGRLEILPAYSEGKDNALEAPQLDLTSAGGTTPELITVQTSGGGDGFIRTTEEPLGLVVDSVDNRVLLTKGDIVFIKMNDPTSVTIGDTYSIFERAQEIHHPETGETIGDQMTNLGFVQVTEVRNETIIAKIGDVYREVMRGAELYEYIPAQKEISLQRGTATDEGVIIAARDEKGTFSTNDVIYINLGTDNAVASGNLLYIKRPRVVSDEILKKGGAIDLPDAVLGAAVVIEPKKETASVLIIKSVDAAFIGDQIEIVTD